MCIYIKKSPLYYIFLLFFFILHNEYGYSENDNNKDKCSINNEEIQDIVDDILGLNRHMCKNFSDNNLPEEEIDYNDSFTIKKGIYDKEISGLYKIKTYGKKQRNSINEMENPHPTKFTIKKGYYSNKNPYFSDKSRCNGGCG